MFVSSMAILLYLFFCRFGVPPFTFAKWTTKTGVNPDSPSFSNAPCPLGVLPCRITSHIHPFLAVGPQENFLTCKMKMVIIPGPGL